MRAPDRRPPLAAEVEGRGPAVVLLHGQPGRGADWRRVTARLYSRYTTVAPDRLGYGRTGGAAGDFAANAAATVELMDSLGVARAVAVGHSWGGAVALQLALAAPERLSGLVLVASVSPGEPVGRVDRLLARRPLGDAVALATLGVAGRALAVPTVRRAVARALPADPGELVAQAGPGRRTWRSFAFEQRVFVDHIDDLTGGLGGIAVPTCVVVGDADRVVPPGAGRRLAGAIPDAVLHRVPGAGHLLPWEHPDAVAEAVDVVAGPAAAHGGDADTSG